MSVGQYPFIDIAVHEGIRERFARGEALALFSADFSGVLWANGGGARLFGHGSIYEFMDDGGQSHPAALRQMRSAAERALASGTEQTVLMRQASGFRRSAVHVGISAIFLRGRTRAFLLASDAPDDGASLDGRARRIIEGLSEAGTHVAVLGGTGDVLAASSSVARLDIDPELYRDLVAEVAREEDRLVKRLIDTERGRIPAAIARLTDNPSLHLIFMVETDIVHAPSEPAAARIESSATPVAGERKRPQLRFPQVNAWSLTSAPKPAAEADTAADEPERASQQIEKAATADAARVPSESTAVETGRPPETGGPAIAAEEPEPGGDVFAFDPKGRAVRFVWKIDAEGRFSDISPEFAATVGPNAADIVGRRFEDVARVFGLDRDRAIVRLLEHRDTWSGRSVLWPVQGSRLSVPIDLAALPTYTRERTFSGFRGFGIVRVGDAVEDPEAIGLSLTGPTITPGAETVDISEVSPATDADISATTAEPREEEFHDEEAEATDDPFRGEVPALRIVPASEQPDSDKVIKLEEHRPRAREGLSTGEQAAFREIGKRLASAFGDPETGEEKPKSSDDRTASESKHGSAAVPDETTGHSDKNEGTRPAPSAGIEVPSAFALPRNLAREGVLDDRLLDELPVALLVHAGETVLHANPELLEMTGYQDLEALRDAGGLGALFAAPHYSGDGSGTLPGTVTLIRADGSEGAVHARLQSIGWRDGRALMLSLVPVQQEVAGSAAPETAEATEQIAALTVEVEELRSILETATDGVVILGEQGEIRSMNGSASALFDYDTAELRGQPFVKLFAHESQRAVMEYLNGLVEHGVASVLNDGREVIGREAGGGFLPLFMTIGRLSGSNGYCAVMRDITQWKRTEEELRSAKRAAEAASSHKSEFLARVSHEIRTPLNAIIGFSDMMAEQRFGPIGSPRYLEYAHDIGRSGKHVLDIVNDLLDISKIEAGEMEVAFTAVALNDAIAETVALLQPQANSQRVIIRTSLSSSVPEIVADERSIRQIAINLLSNSIRFTPSGGQIVVSTAYESNGSVALRIRDTGVGMTRSELEQAMKPFRQVSGAARHRGDGTGLGLPLTKAMVEANRAQFDIRSAPGEGTLVEILFPSQRVLAD